GTFRGISAHYSGDGFSDMHFEVRAVPPGEFTAWVQATRAGARPLNAARYAELARQSQHDAPSTFSAVEDGLFQAILTQRLAPGPGPAPEPHPGAPSTLQEH
ncbi:MAG: cytochrome o ubiquinol oxidase subunit, partial [Variovorax sp.]|nr:cytochrome o ubiquinol oxidase subunit [Variovorax sp.]